MIRGIDHLVIACADPDAAANELESTVGLTATGGGRHAGRGSWNRIVWLADGSYLELIGIADADLASRSPVGAAAVRALEANGGGLATYALTEDDVEIAAAALGAIGAFGPVAHGSRTRHDGEVVEWWTAFPLGDLGPDATPFLIQHAYTGAEWGADALPPVRRTAIRSGHRSGSLVSTSRRPIRPPRRRRFTASSGSTSGPWPISPSPTSART